MTKYDTRAMQLAAANWAHDRRCIARKLTVHSLDRCTQKDAWVEEAGWLVAAMLPAITRDVVIPARAAAKRTTREAVAQEIEAKLVCCDLYEQVELWLRDHPEDVDTPYRQLAAKVGMGYHSICHWGGYAAAIAREGCKPAEEPSEPLSPPTQQVDGFHHSERLTDRRWGERYLTGAGQSLWVHKRVDCKGPVCVIHSWPAHLDRAKWRTYWRADIRVMEVLCQHGVGHPAPGHIDRTGVDRVHGCDGCCEAIRHGEADVRAAGPTRSAA